MKRRITVEGGDNLRTEPSLVIFHIQQSMVATLTGKGKAVVQHADKEKEN